MREGSRRGSSSDPAGSSSAQPGLAEAGGERGRLGLTERERDGGGEERGEGWQRRATVPRCGRSWLLQQGPWQGKLDMELNVVNKRLWLKFRGKVQFRIWNSEDCLSGVVQKKNPIMNYDNKTT